MLVPKTYEILSLAIEEGVARGISRAFKHTDTPSREILEEHMESAVMDSIFEYFDIKPHTQDENIIPVPPPISDVVLQVPKPGDTNSL